MKLSFFLFNFSVAYVVLLNNLHFKFQFYKFAVFYFFFEKNFWLQKKFQTNFVKQFWKKNWFFLEKNSFEKKWKKNKKKIEQIWKNLEKKIRKKIFEKKIEHFFFF